MESPIKLETWKSSQSPDVLCVPYTKDLSHSISSVPYSSLECTAFLFSSVVALGQVVLISPQDYRSDLLPACYSFNQSYFTLSLFSFLNIDPITLFLA